MKTVNLKRFFLFSIMVLPLGLWAQEEVSVLANPEIELSIETDSPWSYEFDISYRNLIYENDYQYQTIQIELEHVTAYALTEHSSIGAGVKYRFREIFSDRSHDELRFLEQYVYKHELNEVGLSHRLRFEQRFRENTTFRLRYKLSGAIELGDSDEGVEFKPQTEFLWGMSKHSKPEAEVRVGVIFEKEVGDDIAASLGVDYRYEDFIRTPYVSIYILGGIEIEL